MCCFHSVRTTDTSGAIALSSHAIWYYSGACEEEPSSALLYLVRMQVLLLTVRVAVVRVISSGPGESTLPLPGITDGKSPGNLQYRQKLEQTESLSVVHSNICIHLQTVYFFMSETHIWLFFQICFMALFSVTNCKQLTVQVHLKNQNSHGFTEIQ